MDVNTSPYCVRKDYARNFNHQPSISNSSIVDGSILAKIKVYAYPKGLYADFYQMRDLYNQYVLPHMENRLECLLEELQEVPGGTSRVGPIPLPPKS